jgi:putative PIN family toxin of toxin-antitoxin system
MKVTCDTNVLVRALLSPDGPAAALLRMIRTGHRLVTSSVQLREVLNVIGRPALLAIHGLSTNRQHRFISRLYNMSDVVPLPRDLPSVVPHDKKDDPIVIAAVVGGADVLCTLDRHLFHVDVIAFCATHGVRVLRDTELLAELRGR